jgi:hypothetical protein
VGRHQLPEDADTQPLGSGRGRSRPVVTVAELLERAVQDETALGLNWPEEDLDEGGQVVSDYLAREWPTGVMPRVTRQAPSITPRCTGRK